MNADASLVGSVVVAQILAVHARHKEVIVHVKMNVQMHQIHVLQMYVPEDQQLLQFQQLVLVAVLQVGSVSSRLVKNVNREHLIV